MSRVPLVAYCYHLLSSHDNYNNVSSVQVGTFACTHAEPCNPSCFCLHLVTKLTFVHRAGNLRQDELRCIACTAAAHLQPAVHLVVSAAGQNSSRVTVAALAHVLRGWYWGTLPFASVLFGQHEGSIKRNSASSVPPTHISAAPLAAPCAATSTHLNQVIWLRTSLWVAVITHLAHCPPLPGPCIVACPFVAAPPHLHHCAPDPFNSTPHAPEPSHLAANELVNHVPHTLSSASSPLHCYRPPLTQRPRT